MNHNGLFAFGTSTLPLAGNPDINRQGFVEVNLAWRDSPGLDNCVFFGEVRVINRVPTDDIEEPHASFDMLLASAIRAYLSRRCDVSGCSPGASTGFAFRHGRGPPAKLGAQCFRRFIARYSSAAIGRSSESGQFPTERRRPLPVLSSAALRHAPTGDMSVDRRVTAVSAGFRPASPLR